MYSSTDISAVQSSLQDVRSLLKTATTDEKKLLQPRLVLLKHRLAEMLDDNKYETLEKKWKSGSGQKTKSLYRLPQVEGQYPESPFRKLDLPEVETSSSGSRCSFCSKPVTLLDSTFGIGKLKKSTRDEIVTLPDGSQLLTEKVVYYTVPVIACPDCVLNIVPTVETTRDRDGNVLSERVVKNNTRFTSLEDL